MIRTFLFTDIEGSTKLWAKHPKAMSVVVEKHDLIIRAVVREHGGTVFKGVGDGICACFESPVDALVAASEIQLKIQAEDWSPLPELWVRIAVHAGEAVERDGDYFGPTLNKLARLLNTAHGGQTLVSRVTFDIARDELPDFLEHCDLGEHRLKDLERAEHVFQLQHVSIAKQFPPLRSLSVLKHNLPVQLTSFIGRDDELNETMRLIKGCRLVSLTGPGGVGKSRLALQLASEVIDEFADGVFVAELASLGDRAEVLPLLLSIFNLKEQSHVPPIQTLLDGLKRRELLLLLDNCEHLLFGVAQIASQILSECAGVKLLCTSREALGIPGEHTFRVPSLEVPSEESDGSDNVLELASTRLFLERASQNGQPFDLDENSSRQIAHLCRRLDGIPLAIELAAARTRSMSISRLSSRLDDRFRLLTGGVRTALPRQQTLRALIDWSYDLLGNEEQAVFRQLSVFAGGWTLEAAEGVTGKDSVFEVLDQLVEKSLVMFDPIKDRYSMLETVRQYSRDRLSEAGEIDEARASHLQYVHRWLGEWRALENKIPTDHWLAEFEADQENVHAAMEFAVSSRNTVIEAMRLHALARHYWAPAMKFQARLEWSERILAAPGAEQQSVELADLLSSMAVSKSYAGDHQQALGYLAKAKAMALALEAEQLLHEILAVACWIAFRAGSPQEALQYAEESLTFHDLEPVSRGYALGNKGNALFMLGQLEEARNAYEECIECAKLAGYSTGGIYCNLGKTAFREGKKPECAKYYIAAFENVQRPMPPSHAALVGMGIVICFYKELGAIFLARLYTLAAATLEKESAVADPVDEWGLEAALAHLKQQLGPKFDELSNESLPVTIEERTAEAISKIRELV